MAMPDAELRDEIAWARIHATSGKDMVKRREFARKLADLLGEAGHREWVADGVPW